MTLPELLTAMAILGFVMTGILAVFVGGLRATTDMNERFQAQQDGRLALNALRNEAGSACSESVATGGASVTLAIPDATNGCSSSTQVTWCVASASGAAPFDLYRQTGATCGSSTGVKRAGSLTTSAVFTAVTATGSRPKLQVTFPVDANLSSTKGTYTLNDSITLRNASVS
jgi:prepilin-type N-terminal cleavage/methylation domain-containing protein